jgi:hypothetical protein
MMRQKLIQIFLGQILLKTAENEISKKVDKCQQTCYKNQQKMALCVKII